jgi:hypothetical protein
LDNNCDRLRYTRRWTPQKNDLRAKIWTKTAAFVVYQSNPQLLTANAVEKNTLRLIVQKPDLKPPQLPPFGAAGRRLIQLNQPMKSSELH